MNIIIIGSGNVATHLGKAFFAAGHSIRQVWSREYDHADLLAQQINARPIDKLSQIRSDADVYILAVRDDALFDLALDLRFRDALVLHTSGSVSMSVLRPISRHYGVIWAPQSFVRDVPMNYEDLPFCIEGSSQSVENDIASLVRTISDHVFSINGEQRRWLHLASVMVNNFGNALNALSQDLLAEHDIPFEILHPLISITATKIKQSHNLWNLQTGPAVRNDEKTINEHRKLIADKPQLLQLYDLMTDFIIHATH